MIVLDAADRSSRVCRIFGSRACNEMRVSYVVAWIFRVLLLRVVPMFVSSDFRSSAVMVLSALVRICAVEWLSEF